MPNSKAWLLGNLTSSPRLFAWYAPFPPCCICFKSENKVTNICRKTKHNIYIDHDIKMCNISVILRCFNKMGYVFCSLNGQCKCINYACAFFFFPLFPLSALNLRRRPWYAHLPSCPPPLPPRWTLKCPIRVNQGAPAANHSPHPATPRRWVPKGLRMWQGAWGWRTARALPLAQALRLKSKGREAPQWSRLSSQRVAHPLVRKKVRTTAACTYYYQKSNVMSVVLVL